MLTVNRPSIKGTGPSASNLPLIGLRDWAVLLGACWLLARADWSAFRRMPPRPLGKATTALQFLFILTVLTDGIWARPVFVPAAIVSGAAALDYLCAFRPAAAARSAPR